MTEIVKAKKKERNKKHQLKTQQKQTSKQKSKMLLYIVRKNNYLIQKEFPLLKLNMCLLPTVQAKKKPTIYLLEYFFGFFFQQIPCLN